MLVVTRMHDYVDQEWEPARRRSWSISFIRGIGTKDKVRGRLEDRCSQRSLSDSSLNCLYSWCEHGA